MLLSESIIDQIAEAIADQGYIVIEQAIPSELAEQLRLEAQHRASHFKPAGVGRGSAHQRIEKVRSDDIQWIESGASEAQNAWLALMDNLQQGLNRRLFMGLFFYESHFAHYRPGAFYEKHLDAFRGQSNRVLSTVTYLNADWEPGWGGQLNIYGRDGETLLNTVSPKLGTLVIFLSEDFPHEVAAATHERFSIAGWFRINNSNTTRVDPPR